MTTTRSYINLNRIAEEKKEYLHLDNPLPHIQLPITIDLRDKFPPVYNQGALGSCTANAIGGAIEYDLNGFEPSRLFIYYNERLFENTVNSDAGALITDGIRSLKKYGVCKETDWPYDISKFEVQPTPQSYINASKHKLVSANNIKQDINTMKNWLNTGFPFVVGIEVFNEFETQEVATSGIVPMPTANSQCLGGHAVLCVGYDDSQQHWIMRNSWGSSWGINGYFYLPYAYLLDTSLSSDLWIIKSIQN